MSELKGSHLPKVSEAESQAAFVMYVRLKHPELVLFHIPNGEKRNAITGAKLKRLGVLPGVPDLFLARARGIWHGLFIEMKDEVGRLNSAQKEVTRKLSDEVYKVVVCRGVNEAIKALDDYLMEK